MMEVSSKVIQSFFEYEELMLIFQTRKVNKNVENPHYLIVIDGSLFNILWCIRKYILLLRYQGRSQNNETNHEVVKFDKIQEFFLWLRSVNWINLILLDSMLVRFFKLYQSCGKHLTNFL